MVRIPVYDPIDRTLSTGIQYFRPASSAGLRSIGSGLETLASGLQDSARVLTNDQELNDRFIAERGLLDLDDRARNIIRDAQENISETGQGFHNRTMTLIQEEARKFLESVPESQRRDMEISIKRFLNQQSAHLANIEISRNRDFIKDVTQRHLDRLSNNIVTGIWDMPTAMAENDRFLSAMGGPPEQTKFFRQQFKRATESARLEFLRKNRPDEFLRQSLRFQPNRAATTASKIQRLVIDQARLHKMDPLLALTIAKLESSFNPNAGGAGSVRGLMQMTRATRARLARMLGVKLEAMNDPAFQVAGLSILMREAQTRLEANGHPVTATNLWANHFLGNAGAMAFLNANRTDDAYTVYRSVAGQRTADLAFKHNPGLLERGRTVGQVLDAIHKRVTDAQKSVAGLLTHDPEIAPSAPLGKFLGENFEVMTPADLARYVAKAQIDVDQRFASRLTEAAGDEAENAPAGNMYDAAWRRSQDDLAASMGAHEKILSGDAEAISFWSQFADKHGYLPKSVVSAVRSMIASSNRAQQIVGYEMAARVARHNQVDGLRLSGFGGDSDARGANQAAMIRDYINLTTHLGLPPNEAARRVELTHSPEWQQRSQDKDFNRRLETMAAQRTWSEVAEHLKMTGSWIPQMFGGRPDTQPPDEAIRQRIEERYQDFFRFHFREKPDFDTAKANALADIEWAFNDTGLFGTAGSRMPYPPERTNPPLIPLPTTTDANGVTRPVPITSLTPEQFRARYGYIEDQALAVVRGFAERRKDPDADSLTARDVFLIPTNATRRDVEQRVPARYRLVYRSPSEGLVMVTHEWRADVAAAREARLRGETNDPPPAAAKAESEAPQPPRSPIIDDRAAIFRRKREAN